MPGFSSRMVWLSSNPAVSTGLEWHTHFCGGGGRELTSPLKERTTCTPGDTGGKDHSLTISHLSELPRSSSHEAKHPDKLPQDWYNHFKFNWLLNLPPLTDGSDLNVITITKKTSVSEHLSQLLYFSYKTSVHTSRRLLHPIPTAVAQHVMLQTMTLSGQPKPTRLPALRQCLQKQGPSAIMWTQVIHLGWGGQGSYWRPWQPMCSEPCESQLQTIKKFFSRDTKCTPGLWLPVCMTLCARVCVCTSRPLASPPKPDLRTHMSKISDYRRLD